MQLAQVDKIINEKFTVSLMSDSKWHKLIESLCETSNNGIHLYYKLVYSEEVYSSNFDFADTPFFSEPTLYREVEWIKIPSSYEALRNENNYKAGSSRFTQNLKAILTAINSVGVFEIAVTDEVLTIYAYKK